MVVWSHLSMSSFSFISMVAKFSRGILNVAHSELFFGLHFPLGHICKLESILLPSPSAIKLYKILKIY